MRAEDRPLSKDLKPGTVVRWRGCSDVVLERRKDPHEPTDHHLPFFPGWWLADNRGGLADRTIDDPNSGWEVVMDERAGVDRAEGDV